MISSSPNGKSTTCGIYWDYMLFNYFWDSVSNSKQSLDLNCLFSMFGQKQNTGSTSHILHFGDSHYEKGIRVLYTYIYIYTYEHPNIIYEYPNII